MSLTETVFNRSTMKVVVALAIPSSIGFFFWYSAQEAQRQILETQKALKDNPTSANTVINDYTMKEVDDANRVRWQLSAKSGTIINNGQDVDLTGVRVQYYDPTTKALKMKLNAPVGSANQATKFVKLRSDKTGRVMAEGEGGKSKFTADQVELTKGNHFVATGGVIIDWPGIAKVSGNSATGTTNMADGPKDLKIVGNTHAEIAVR